MIRVSDEAKRLLGTIWTPDGEVLRLVLGSPGAAPMSPLFPLFPLFPFTGR